MAAAKIKKGDKVVVLSGKDKGKHGEVTKSMPKDGKVDRVGREHHHAPQEAEPDQPAGRPGAAEAPLHVSKVALEDPKTGAPTRVRFEVRDGNKVRVAARSGETING
jgi:large subunit ribosomal protein L24